MVCKKYTLSFLTWFRPRMHKVVVLTAALLFAFATAYTTMPPSTNQLVVTFGGLRPNTLPTVSSTEDCLPTSQALNSVGNIIQLSLAECTHAEFSISFDWESDRLVAANHPMKSQSTSQPLGNPMKLVFSVDSEDCDLIETQVDGEWHLNIASCQHNGPHRLLASHPSSTQYSSCDTVPVVPSLRVLTASMAERHPH